MNIVLRPWNNRDINRLVEIANNPKIAANLTNRFKYPYKRMHGEEFISMATSANPPFVLCIEIDGNVAGGIGVHAQEDVMCKNMEMGYWLGEQYWGKGIITKSIVQMLNYAYTNFDCNRIYARPYGKNIASQKALLKVGFKKEGEFKKAIFKNGAYRDLLVYAMLRENWVEKSQ